MLPISRVSKDASRDHNIWDLISEPPQRHQCHVEFVGNVDWKAPSLDVVVKLELVVNSRNRKSHQIAVFLHFRESRVEFVVGDVTSWTASGDSVEQFCEITFDDGWVSFQG